MMRVLYNPLTGQWIVINANPKGDNQYSNPDGVSFKAPIGPSIPLKKIAKGLYKDRTMRLADDLASDAFSGRDPLTPHYVDQMKRTHAKALRSAKSPRIHFKLKDIVDSMIKEQKRAGNEGAVKDLTSISKKHQRSLESFIRAKQSKGLNPDLFLKRKDWRTPSIKVIPPLEIRGDYIRRISPANTPREYPEYD